MLEISKMINMREKANLSDSSSFIKELSKTDILREKDKSNIRMVKFSVVFLNKILGFLDAIHFLMVVSIKGHSEEICPMERVNFTGQME